MDTKDPSNGGTNRRLRCATCGQGPQCNTDSTLERTGVCAACTKQAERQAAR